MDDDSKLFNRPLYRLRRARRVGQWQGANFLKQEAASFLADKLFDINRTFPLALDLGSHGGEVAAAIAQRAGKVIRADSIAATQPDIVCDEEWVPFSDNTFDLVVSALSLHHVNDLPGTFIQIRRCLKPDGLMLAMLPGASTLRELREAITQASARYGFPLAPRLSPLLEIRDAGALMQRAGFALPVLESETITVEYSSVMKLLQDLQAMGESNVLSAQFMGMTSRAQLAAIVACYEELYGSGATVPATFEAVTLLGWKPHESQQKPSARGSATAQIKNIIQ